MTRFAVLASGTGTGFVSIVDSLRTGVLAQESLELAGLICNRSKAPVLERARERGVETTLVSRTLPSPETTDPLIAASQQWNVDWLVCAGWTQILPVSVLQHFWDPSLGVHRIVNIHPSLLPAFPGLHSYRQAWDHGNSVTGVTVHLIDAGLDTGPICAQEAFSIQDCTSAEEVGLRGQKIEHRLYPETLAWVLSSRFEFKKTRTESGDSRRIHVRTH